MGSCGCGGVVLRSVVELPGRVAGEWPFVTDLLRRVVTIEFELDCGADFGRCDRYDGGWAVMS